MKKLVILTGPTAVGKTELSIRLAKAIDGEIISADSIQVYKHMDIGSDKITKEEMSGVKHYLIDVFEPDVDFNVHTFQTLTKKYIDEIYLKGKIPIIVGGTGFYIQSVLYDIKFDETDDAHEYRYELEEIAKTDSSSLYKMLCDIDPESAKIIHENNVKRVIRALEYYHDTGLKISDHNYAQRQNVSPYLFSYFVLNMDRSVLYSRINERVRKMFDQGLVSEVEALLSMGYDENLVSMQGIGYKETLQYIKGNLSIDETIDLIQKNTRHFAKRQLTWFRREKDVTMVTRENFNNNQNKILEFLLNNLKENGIIDNGPYE